MSKKILAWLKSLETLDNSNLDDDILKKHKDVIDYLVANPNASNLGIAIKASTIIPSLSNLPMLEHACIKNAPQLLEKLRFLPGADRNKVENNIIKELTLNAALSKTAHWYKDLIPDNLQIILAWKLYDDCYKNLTNGQQSDRYLTKDTALAFVDILQKVPTELKNEQALLLITKAVAYILRSGELSDLLKHSLPSNFNEIALQSLWSYAYSKDISSEKDKWVTFATGVTLDNQKLISSNLAWLQMNYPLEYTKLQNLENSSAKEITDFIKLNKKKLGITENIMSRKHTDNSPIDIDYLISM